MDKRIATLIFFSFLLIISNTVTARVCDSSEENWQSQIGIIISPIISWTTIHEIEIYWNHVNFQLGDTIALYTEKPNEEAQPIYTLVPNGPSGVKRTGLRADFIFSSSLNFTKQCLKYHVAWQRNNIIIKTNCHETQPTWMRERKHILGSLRMSNVFLPGTHNSGSYAVYTQPRVENLIERHAITQDIDVLSQLIYGVRYLDIRIGRYPNRKEIWWVNHGIYRSVPLISVIEQVKNFLDNTEEIVIFDVQEFPVGFDDNLTIHQELVSYLEEQFNGYYLPQNYGWISTLNDIWASGKRLIIGYDEARIVSQYKSVWPCVTHQWGNVRSRGDLYRYLNRIEKRNSGNRLIPRSAMAELTANAVDVILNRLGSLRQMAHRVNANVTSWYSSIWQDTANIVAVDFVRNSGIIETAIEANERRHANCRF